MHSYLAWKPDETETFVLDTEHYEQCVDQRRCGMCGEPLGYWFWFLDESPERRDHRIPALHEDCLEAATEVHPWGEKDVLYAQRVRQYDVRIEKDGAVILNAAKPKETRVFTRKVSVANP